MITPESVCRYCGSNGEYVNERLSNGDCDTLIVDTYIPQQAVRCKDIQIAKLTVETLLYQDQIKALKKSGELLKSAAEHIGWTSCEDIDTLRKAEKAITQWDELIKKLN